MPIIYYKGHKKTLRLTAEDIKAILKLGKTYKIKRGMFWKEILELPDYKELWFSKLYNNISFSKLYRYLSGEKKKYPNKPYPNETHTRYRVLLSKIYKEIPEERKLIKKKSIWSPEDFKLLNKLANKYKIRYNIKWNLLSKDKEFKKLPIKDIPYLRRYLNTTRRNNQPDIIIERRKKALEYKKKNRERYRELQNNRATKKLATVNAFLREKASKKGRIIHS